MKRRIFAWVLLAGFVLLLLNVMFIKFYWQLSMVIYLIIAFAFLIYNGKATRERELEDLRKKIDGEKGGKDGSENDMSEAGSNNENESNEE